MMVVMTAAMPIVIMTLPLTLRKTRLVQPADSRAHDFATLAPVQPGLLDGRYHASHLGSPSLLKSIACLVQGDDDLSQTQRRSMPDLHHGAGLETLTT